MIRDREQLAFVLTEPDARLWRGGSGLEEWQQFSVDIAERGIVPQECLVDLREPLEYGMVCRDVLAQTDEGSDHVNAHLHRAPAAQHVRRHQCAVLCERPRVKSRVPVLLGTGHNL